MKLIKCMVIALGMQSCSAMQMNHQELLQQFSKPLPFTRASIQDFLSTIFNHQLYGSLCLPSNFMHISDFLSHSAKVQNPRTFSTSIFNLFQTRLKESHWVNPYALAQILTVISEQCAPLCMSQEVQTRAGVKKTLYNAMLSRFQELKADPEYFMDQLTQEIMDVVQQSEKDDVRDLQHAINKFVESALDKVVWSPEEQENCWESCKFLAEQLAALHAAHIIKDATALNQCYWSLVYRFCYFLDTMGDQLTAQTYSKIKNDIAEHTCAFLEHEEQEACILPKIKKLQHAIIQGETKSRSAQAGIWTNPVTMPQLLTPVATT